MVANLKLVANSTWHEEKQVTLDSVANKNIDELLLKPDFILDTADEAAPSYKMMTIVTAAHLVILAAILSASQDVPVINKVMTPMTVSLVNMPSSDEPQLKPEAIPQQPKVIEVPKKTAATKGKANTREDRVTCKRVGSNQARSQYTS